MMHLRGRHSQRAFSRTLGFESNVAYAWEHGRRFPEASTFFRAAERKDRRAKAKLLAFLQDYSDELEAARLSSPRTVQHLLLHLVGRGNRVALARRLGVDRTTLARWLQGKTEPRLPELLAVIEATTQRLLAFVELFADPAKLESTRAAHTDLLAQRELAYDLPWSHAILRALELEEYSALPTHRPGYLGDAIGLSAQQERRYLQKLKQAGQIRWDGTHYRVDRVLTVDTREDPIKNRQLKAHWANVGLSRIQDPQTSEESLFSFNLFAISEEAFQRVRALHLQYYDQVRAIIDESPRSDRVVLMNLQLIPLSHSKRPG